MSNVAKLKKKASELEERRQYDKALAVYQQVLEQMSMSDDDVDVGLFNRVGDLTLRQGNVAQAVAYYEQAVDMYTEGGFFNNAIALCNKILRNAPGRTSIYLKLGKISARKGFTSDAKQNFLEYADRMQKAGQWDDAFTALEEFADLCPDQDDVRLMLAEQLTRRDRKEEALTQLQILYGRYLAEGRSTEANAALDRMKALDPDFVPQVAPQAAPAKNSGLVFLDVNYDAPFEMESAPQKPAEHEVSEPTSSQWEDRERADSGDPRASGAMRTIDPADFFNRTLTPPESTAIPAAAAPDSGGDPPHGSPGELRQQEPSHDLALEGVLPILQTPGLERPLLDAALPPLVDLPELDIELPADDSPEVHHAGLITNLGGTPAHGSDASIIMPPLYRAPDQELQISNSGSGAELGIVHGAGPAAASGKDGTGAESLASLAESMRPADGLLDLTTSLSRESLKSIAWSPSELKALLRDEPDDFTLHRRLGEVLIEEGERGAGLAELDVAMLGFEGKGDIKTALSVAEEVIRLEPDSIRHHQKRVEYAYRSNDQRALLDAYLELADALFRTAQLGKSKAVYERVLELAPGNERAEYALSVLLREETGTAAADAPAGIPTPGAVEASPAVTTGAESSAGDFVNLGDLLREDEEPRTTRMVVEDEEPSGDEDADFQDMLEKFKRGLAENVDAEDYESHYDLGVAFREMGLLDEAIAQFQRALRGTRNRVRTLEALGQCFVERSQFQVAANVLERALGESGSGDENLVGVLYLLGYANEALQKYTEALSYYQRVFMVDIQFRDVTERMSALEKVRSDV